MRGVQRIAEQHDVVVPPALVADHREDAPDAAVGDQPVAVEPVGPERLHIGEQVGLGEIGDLAFGALPGGLGRLDDPGALADPVPVGAEHPDPVLVLGEVEGEGVMGPGRAEPEEAVAAVLDTGPEAVAVALPHGGVDAVGTDHQVEFAERGGIADLGLETEIHAQFGAAPLQHGEKLAAAAAAEAVPGAADRLAVEDEIDLVPVDEHVADRVIARRVVVAEIVQRLVGEDDAEAETVVAPVALEDRDPPARPRLLRQQREIEPGRAAADDGELHGAARSVRPCPLSAARRACRGAGWQSGRAGRGRWSCVLFPGCACSPGRSLHNRRARGSVCPPRRSLPTPSGGAVRPNLRSWSGATRRNRSRSIQ